MKKKNNSKNSCMCDFVAYIKTSPIDRNPENNSIFFSIDKNEENILWDDVVDKIYGEMNKQFPEKFYPEVDIFGVFIFDHENQNGVERKKYPVVAESSKDEISKLNKSKKYEKFLVLPEATYRLTAECAVFMKLKELGYLSDAEEFDCEDMKQIVEIVKEYVDMDKEDK